MKRSHDQMSSESRQSPCASNHRDPSNQPAQSSSNSLFNFSLSPIRRSFDLRRPVMSQPRPEPRNEVIDLTEEPSSPAELHTIPPPRTNTSNLRANRPPRFDRNIISIDEQEDRAIDLREESPEIQFHFTATFSVSQCFKTYKRSQTARTHTSSDDSTSTSPCCSTNCRNSSWRSPSTSPQKTALRGFRVLWTSWSRKPLQR